MTLVLETELGECGVVLQRLDERQDALAGEMVGVKVDAGDGLVATQRASDGVSHVVIRSAVRQSEALNMSVFVQSLCKLDERFRLDDL